jgi:biopolymer transport protein ExbB
VRTKNTIPVLLIASLLVAVAQPLIVHATGEDVDALVESVRQEALREAEYDEERIERFLDVKEEQQGLLDKVKADFAAANRRADTLRKQYEENEETLTDYEVQLQERAGDLNDLFAIVRQTALNANGVLDTSLVAAEQRERSPFLQELGKGEKPPSIDEIKQLWTMVLSEISESGKVVKFDATVIKPQGEEIEQPVVRAGVFNAVSNGAFLRYLPESGKLVELSRQPPPRYQSMAADLQAATGGIVPMALDPSKGAILSAIVQTPDMKETIKQGGTIGYLILALGALGVLMLITKAIGLTFAGGAISRQAKSEKPTSKNALGRLQSVATETDAEESDVMGIRLDEQLAAESSKLNWGLPTIAVLAGVSPLLGLLGTVTGMIETFQSITLFGTGDPKLMSGGISQALVTTQLGLAVAIPLVVFHSLMQGWVNSLIERLGKFSSDLLTGHGID